MTRTCDVEGCDEPIPAWCIMCREHWLSLPVHLRAIIHDARRAARKSRATSEDKAAYERALQAARDCLAIDYIPPLQPPEHDPWIAR